jgi:GAF domain-containing protein/pyridoxamine 5'-phosphate oxidase-like protein
MTIALSDLSSCFEGVIPSIITTVAPDGTPNISYLSHVVRVDDGHVALSNQFFSKTAINVRANPRAALLVVDALSGLQYRLDIAFEESSEAGPLFERMAADLRAASLQIGMGSVMRLRAVDVYRVLAIRKVRSPVMRAAPVPGMAAVRLKGLGALAAALAEADDLGSLLETTLAGLHEEFGFRPAMILAYDAARERLTTIASAGYGRTGIGSEVALGDGMIGTAAVERRSLRISDMSRTRRLGGAIEASSAVENHTRTISLPGLPGAMSQLAVPLVVHHQLKGVLVIESERRLAFSPEDELAMGILGRHLAMALSLVETDPPEVPAARTMENAGAQAAGPRFRVVHHGLDDSVFIDNEYIVRGVPGRLLMAFLRTYASEGRREFSNKEIRADQTLRLPDFKDNLETRLLLLQRRLQEKQAPVQVERPARGRILLIVCGQPVIERGNEG